jgi:hypothetical protein
MDTTTATTKNLMNRQSKFEQKICFANKFENFTSKLIEINDFFHNYVIFDFCQTALAFI